jgi:hypothetical protein
MTWDAEDLIRKGTISFGEIVRLKYWKEKGSSEQKALGEEFYEKALAAFKKAKLEETKDLAGDLNISIFACGCGAFVTPDGKFWHSIIERAIEFDWLEALPLLNAINNLAARSCDLWPADSSSFRSVESATRAGQDRGKSKNLKSWLSGRARRTRARRAKESVARREPHRDRVYEICTALFSAINMEALYRAEKQADGSKLTQEPSPHFRKRLRLIAPSIDDAESNFHRAAQRYAQGLYGRGMVFGIVVVILLCGALGAIFLARHLPAWYGVAIFAGGIGATVSVLQRMASGHLRLEYDAGPGTLLTLGAVRPVIGSIFGVILFCAVEGGWLPAVHISTPSALAFFAVLGFLAGFNERFAQDMLVVSAGQLSGQSRPQTEPDSQGGDRFQRSPVNPEAAPLDSEPIC